MRIMNVKVFTFAAAIAVILGLNLSASAQDSAALFKSRCAGCHAADGTGSPMGKKLGAHDFASADVQKMSDADLPLKKTAQSLVFGDGSDDPVAYSGARLEATGYTNRQV